MNSKIQASARTKDILAKKGQPSAQMALISLRWQQMRLLELSTKGENLPKQAANLDYHPMIEEESA